jgi:hypothetical protein
MIKIGVIITTKIFICELHCHSANEVISALLLGIEDRFVLCLGEEVARRVSERVDDEEVLIPR